MKVSWLAAASMALFVMASGLAYLFPETTAGKVAQAIASVAGTLGHFVSPVIKPSAVIDGGK